MKTAIRLKTQEQKQTKTIMDTMMVTPMDVKKWKAPPFQREVKENSKVIALSEELKADGGVWPGVVTLGVLNGETYVIDGQHRRAAFLIARIPEGYTDVRIHYMDSMAEMGEEFVKLNSQLVRMGPDDILRGLEPSVLILQTIRKECQFIGYDSVRRNDKSPVVSMSVSIRAWRASHPDVPAYAGGSAHAIACAMSDDTTKEMCAYMRLALTAFGRDAQYYRLWGFLNLVLTMWLYRRLVLDKTPIKKATRFSSDLFCKALMALSADPVYMDWLQGRKLSERDRAPAYARIKAIFAKRAASELGSKVLLPQPAWSRE